MRGRSALGLLLVGGGILWILQVADIVDLAYATWIGLILIGIGFALALTRGRYGLLVLVGVLVLLAGLPALVVDGDVLEGGIGDAEEAPESSLELDPFRQGIGKLTVDLTDPALDLDGRTVDASVGIGDLLVLVPVGTDASVDAHVGAGNIDAFGENENGVDVRLTTISGTSGTQEVDLELEVGIGNIRVERD
jgi:Cell wall-active antibiotics response 4TMS YvqF